MTTPDKLENTHSADETSDLQNPLTGPTDENGDLIYWPAPTQEISAHGSAGEEHRGSAFGSIVAILDNLTSNDPKNREERRKVIAWNNTDREKKRKQKEVEARKTREQKRKDAEEEQKRRRNLLPPYMRNSMQPSPDVPYHEPKFNESDAETTRQVIAIIRLSLADTYHFPRENYDPGINMSDKAKDEFSR